MSIKKFYWLKLQNDFFIQKTIKKLRKIAGGDTYTIIYLKLQLLSLKNQGKLYFESMEDTFADELSLELDEDPENIKVTLLFLEKHGLLITTAADEFILLETIKNIGSESDSAARVRKYREKLKLLQCNNIVTNCNTEKDEDVEIEKEKNENKDSRLVNICPKCGIGYLVIRWNAEKKNNFWGCSEFSNGCNYSQNYFARGSEAAKVNVTMKLETKPLEDCPKCGGEGWYWVTLEGEGTPRLQICDCKYRKSVVCL